MEEINDCSVLNCQITTIHLEFIPIATKSLEYISQFIESFRNEAGSKASKVLSILEIYNQLLFIGKIFFCYICSLPFPLPANLEQIEKEYFGLL